MAVPKKRCSSCRRDKRRGGQTHKIWATGTVTCPNCKDTMIPHHVCPSCGQYNKVAVIAMQKEKTDAPSAKKEAKK